MGIKFKVINVEAKSGTLWIDAEHYTTDEDLFLIERYEFQGREGLRYDREQNGSGEYLLSDDEVAPRRDPDITLPDRPGRQYLPDGSAWKYKTTIGLTQANVLATIGEEHAKFLASPPSFTDGRNPKTGIASSNDLSGITKLTSVMASLLNHEEGY